MRISADSHIFFFETDSIFIKQSTKKHNCCLKNEQSKNSKCAYPYDKKPDELDRATMSLTMINCFNSLDPHVGMYVCNAHSKAIGSGELRCFIPHI